MCETFFTLLTLAPRTSHGRLARVNRTTAKATPFEDSVEQPNPWTRRNATRRVKTPQYVFPGVAGRIADHKLCWGFRLEKPVVCRSLPEARNELIVDAGCR